jgi:hypothetical protein
MPRLNAYPMGVVVCAAGMLVAKDHLDLLVVNGCA